MGQFYVVSSENGFVKGRAWVCEYGDAEKFRSFKRACARALVHASIDPDLTIEVLRPNVDGDDGQDERIAAFCMNGMLVRPVLAAVEAKYRKGRRPRACVNSRSLCR